MVAVLVLLAFFDLGSSGNFMKQDRVTFLTRSFLDVTFRIVVNNECYATR